MLNFKKKILVIDNSNEFSKELNTSLDSGKYKVQEANSIDQGVQELEQSRFSLIILNFTTPSSEQLEELDKIKKSSPLVPLILATTKASNDFIAKALKKGIINIFNTPAVKNITTYLDSLMPIFDRLNNYSKDIYPLTSSYEKTIVVKSKEKIIEYVPNFLLDDLVQMGYFNQNDFLAISTAMIEALANSLYHGNFEIGSEIRNVGNLSDQKLFKDAVKQKENLIEYSQKELIINCYCDQKKIEISITDQGRGFDTSKHEKLDFNDLSKLTTFSGKGMFLMKSLMDKVFYNDLGNKITLVKNLYEKQ